MIVKVHMLANQPEPVVRNVDIPDDNLPTTEVILAQTFYYGQNEFQPVPNVCSVSVGDVIELNDELWLIQGLGFRKMTNEEFAAYKTLSRRDRRFAF